MTVLRNMLNHEGNVRLINEEFDKWYFNINMPWIKVAENAPYFITDTGEAWTPIGQNDAITWPDLQGAFRKKDLPAVEGHLRWLAAHGVTCLRLMMEYCHGENRYFEKPVGGFVPNMVAMWNDIFSLCEKYGLRILLTPFDTFWMWRRWKHHPYKKENGGPASKRSQWLLCTDTRLAIKNRLAFATRRWGGSGVLFGWDLWNEIHPAHSGNDTAIFNDFIENIGSFLRKTELDLYGRAHLQTVSVFGPTLQQHPEIAESIFRHPALDFASVHFYEKGTIDYPKNTLAATIATGRLTREALSHIDNNRPFLDTEHGPIHFYKTKKRTLPEAFDDEYFRHMQWAHLASGGAGGGMRWPYRLPHVLTHGMRRAQMALSRFLPLIDWTQFDRKNLNEEVLAENSKLKVFACGHETQCIVWLMRTDTYKKGMLQPDAKALETTLQIPGLKKGLYQITSWDTVNGATVQQWQIFHIGEAYLYINVNVKADMALAIVSTNESAP